jgi:predicted RNA-binding Zn-ribbon protein involved in translation (DUF1610 family)
MAIIHEFDTDWQEKQYCCPECGNRFRENEMNCMTFSESIEFSCPTCEKVVLIVRCPDFAELEAEAA